MNRILKFQIALVLMCFSWTLLCQQKECVMVEWSKNYGGFLNESANDVIQTIDGGFLAVGYSRSNNFDVAQNFGKADYWVLKVDSLGAKEWERNYGGSENDIASSVVQTPDGGFMVAGGSVSFDLDVTGNHGLEDIWVIKLSANGTLEWSKTYGGSNNERAESILKTSDGGYVLAGYSDSSNGDVDNNSGDFDYWLLKIDVTGNLIWEQTFGGSFADWGFDVKETIDGGYLIAGSTFSDNGSVTSNNGFYDYWLVKTDNSGNLLWERNYGGTLEERAYSIEIDMAGNAYIAGTSNSSDWDVQGNNGSYDFWIIKVDPTGDLIWSKSLGGASEDRAFAVALTTDEAILAAGFSSSSNGDVGGNLGSKDGWLLKLDLDGNVIWENNFGGSKEDRLYEIIERPGGGYIGAGLSASDDADLPANQGSQDLWLITLSPDTLSIDLGNDTTLCSNDALLLEVDLDNITYLWQDGATTPAYAVGTAGEYWLEIDMNGCKARDTIVVDYLSQETIDLGLDTILCEGEILLLSPEIENATFLWRDGSTDEEYSVNIPGTYWVVVTKDGCEQKDTINVDFTTVAIGFPETAFICQGEELELNVERPNGQYLWQDGTSNPIYSISGPGQFSVKVTEGGCSNTDTILVDFQSGPDSIFADYTFICEDEGIWFDASYEGATYLWQDGSIEPRFKAVEEGFYSVQVSINDCIFEEEVELISCERCLYIPNAFSPNGDGINDEFRSFPICEFEYYSQHIFDRWGNLVFKSESPDSWWDGVVDRKDANNDVYIHITRYDLLNNGIVHPQIRTGTISIIR